MIYATRWGGGALSTPPTSTLPFKTKSRRPPPLPRRRGMYSRAYARPPPSHCQCYPLADPSRQPPHHHATGWRIDVHRHGCYHNVGDQRSSNAVRCALLSNRYSLEGKWYTIAADSSRALTRSFGSTKRAPSYLTRAKRVVQTPSGHAFKAVRIGSYGNAAKLSSAADTAATTYSTAELPLCKA